MLDSELEEIIANLRTLGADDADVEAKRAETALPRSVRETLSAFGNTRGGVLILGLDEGSGFVATGVRDSAKLTADLASLCSTDMEPPLRPLVRTHRFEGVDLVVAEIPELEPGRKPCYYSGAGITNGSFVRVGDGDRRLTSYEVQLLIANRGQPRDDEEIVEGASRASLDEDLVANLVARIRKRHLALAKLDPEMVLRHTKVLIGDHVTFAGLLSLGRYPQEVFPQLMVTFVHYPRVTGPDADGTRFIDNVAAEGPIPTMVDDTLMALRRNMSRRATVRGAGRTDTWEYPETALREAIVNALVHRDYSPDSRGAQVQVEMYPDRLVVRNPGGLFGPVTEENLGEPGISAARNATLLKLLEDVVIPTENRTVCENRGSGIPAMLAALRAARMSPPRFSNRIATFTVTFPNHTLLGEDVMNWIAGLSEVGLTESQCVGLAMLKSGEILDNQSYRGASGLDSRVASEELRDLVDRGLVVQTGSRRWARYQLPGQLHRPAEIRRPERRAARGDRRAELLAALGDEERTRADLMERTGYTAKVVSHWLRKLRTEGLVEPVGESVRSPEVRYRRIGKLVPDEGGDHA
ncbi:MAG: ArsR family transcriptional regulator [Micromonosporaceae bacterium]|nr:ArsR family transcriptional regulator [Micromonosporaceae bacterium]